MKKNLRNEMGTALRESTYAYIANPNGGPVHIALTQELDLAGDIWRIEDLAVRLIQTNDMPFSTQTDKHRNRKYLQATKLGKAVLNTLKMDVETLRKHYAAHALNPYVEEFIKLASERNLFEPAWTLASLNDDELGQYCDALNDFVESMRKTGNSTEFKKIIGNFARASNKNFRELSKWLYEHFEQYSRLLILRIDFSYKKPEKWPATVNDSISYEDAMLHRKALFNYLEKALPPDSFVNWAIKLEYGLDKHWHFHALLLLDGSIVREDVTIAKLIGEHWTKSITNGQGLYWNCNAYKDGYKACGIGMISHDDEAAREGLKKAALYMTKVDYYARLLVPGNGRIFWKGNMPTPKSSSVGRPRTRGNTQPGASAG